MRRRVGKVSLSPRTGHRRLEMREADQPREARRRHRVHGGWARGSCWLEPPPVSSENGLSDRTSSGRDGDNVPRVLVVGDAFFDPRHELRCEALHHLLDARSKLVEDVHPRVAANRRTKIVECRRSGSRPVWTVSSSTSDRSQHPEEILSVQPRLSRVVTRDKNARSCVGGPAHKAAAGRSVITRVLLERRRIQIPAKKGAGLFLNKRHLIKSG